MDRAVVEADVARLVPDLRSDQLRDLAHVLDSLIATFRPERIYLFGSQARGDAHPDSDFDLFVVVRHSDEPPHKLAQAAYQSIGSHTTPFDILVMTAKEFAERLPARASLPATVLREGRLLYAA